MSIPNLHTPYTQVDATPKFDLGALSYAPNGNVYRYVKFLDSVTYVAGHVLYPADATLHYVTNDYTGGTAITQDSSATPPTGHVAGICMGIPTTSLRYGWMQVGGIALVFGDGSIAAGQDVIHKHNVDGCADSMAAGAESAAFGLALDADDTANDPLAANPLFHCKLRGLI